MADTEKVTARGGVLTKPVGVLLEDGGTKPKHQRSAMEARDHEGRYMSRSERKDIGEMLE